MEDFNYLLSDDKIAKYPLEKRDLSKLLIYKNKQIAESTFQKIADFISENTLLVCNNTRVIHARINFLKQTGSKIEIFCLEPILPADYVISFASTSRCEWKCLIGNRKKWKNENLIRKININGDKFQIVAQLLESNNGSNIVRFSWTNSNYTFSEILDIVGELPIPPYLNRKTEESDEANYQTVYSRIEGSVAAPTAGLHFTKDVFSQLSKKSISTEELTLHVGAGTFQPVKSDDISQHQMHTEHIVVSLETIKNIKNKIGNIIAVGTTSVRTLESLYYIGSKIIQGEINSFFHVSQWEAYEKPEKHITTEESLEAIINYLEKENLTKLHAETQILIQSGFHFRIINGMITNFHQPKSTLLLLVSAFIGKDWKRVYDYALSNDFRFLSYGDSSLLLK
jgi:S-adenosylmethionine:tRNA ribosyltransferase-isomerase